MAEACAISEMTRGALKKIVWTWTSAADGTVGAAAVNSTTTDIYDGVVIGLVTNPGAGPPTDNYDITITDEDGNDILAGAGADRDATTTEYLTWYTAGFGAVIGQKLKLNVTAAGAGTSGVVTLTLK